MNSFEHEEGHFMGVQTTERKETLGVQTETIIIAENGLGFGDGGISVEAQLAQPEVSNLTPEVLEVGTDIILHEPEVFAEVEEDDDGCGDGRPTAVIYQMVPVVPEHPESSELYQQQFNKSRRRAKLFGGGLVAASSMYRAVILGKYQLGQTVLGERKKTAALLKKANIRHGGHTDNHAHGENCGCGAIDKFDQTFEKALKYRSEIKSVVQLYAGDNWNQEWEADFNYVYDIYEDLQANLDEYTVDAAGVKTRELLEEEGAVIKRLADDHLEDFTILNDVEGTTFDQPKFDEILKQRGVEGAAQAFVVDVWRGRMYADFIAKTAQAEHGMDYNQSYRRALIDFLARSTSGVSATLTAGDQRVFLHKTK
jgi:hypothetical protein